LTIGELQILPDAFVAKKHGKEMGRSTRGLEL